MVLIMVLINVGAITALCAQIQIKKSFERLALQAFQNFSCGSSDW
jgi:hypothetical protein